MTDIRTVYVDMDDVLCATCLGLIDLLRDEFGKTVAYEAVQDFDLGKSFDLTRDELAAFLARAHQTEIMMALAPIEGARETLAAWSAQGYDIAVMTGRPPSTREVSKAWLDNYGFGYDSLQFVDKYSRHHHDPSFDEALSLEDLAAMRFCLAVEDSATTAVFLAENEVAPVVLLDRPWNRYEKNGKIRRLKGWDQLAESGP